jgi:hypothetical protein
VCWNRFSVLLVGFVLTSNALAQDCSITITVLDAESHDALPRAEVSIRLNTTDMPFRTTLTDKSGMVTFEGLSKNTGYYLEARFPGYLWRTATVACNAGGSRASIEPPVTSSVSMVQLIADPKRWHGHPISVEGFLNLEFEGDALYLHKEDWKHGLYRDAIWVDVRDSKCTNWGEINRGYVLLEGTFDAYKNGHMGMFGGELKNITRCIAWRYLR